MSTPPGWTPDPYQPDPGPPNHGAGGEPVQPGYRQQPAPGGPGAGEPGAPGYGAGGPGTGSRSGAPGYAPGGEPVRPGYGQQPGYGAQPGHPAYGTPQRPHGAPHGPYGQQPYPGGVPLDRPARKPNRKIIGLIAGLAVVAIAVVVIVLVVVASIGGGNPRDTAEEFMAALKAKDIDKAHSLLCKDGQAKESKEALREDFQLGDHTIASYRLGTGSTHQREGKDETLIPVTIAYDQGDPLTLTVGVWDEGGQKVCSLGEGADGG